MNANDRIKVFSFLFLLFLKKLTKCACSDQVFRALDSIPTATHTQHIFEKTSSLWFAKQGQLNRHKIERHDSLESSS